jgi:hypothetical protein
MAQRLYILLAIIILSAGLMAVFPDDAAVAQSEIVVVITSPTDGQQLFGLANILGSAGHPTAFDSYTLEYKDQSDPNAPWLLVQPLVRQQVQNDILGAWNTNMIPDGVYGLRLRVFLSDGQIGEFVVSNLRVINIQPTPVPTGAAGDADITLVAPTPGPTPTSLIQQPPGTTGESIGPDTAGDGAIPNAPVDLTTGRRVEKQTRINTSRIRSAFCSGVYLTLGIFGAMLVYTLIRGRLRPYTRRRTWQAQDEYDNE